MVADAKRFFRMKISVGTALCGATIQKGDQRLPFRRTEADMTVIEQQRTAKTAKLREQNTSAGAAGIPTFATDQAEHLEASGLPGRRLGGIAPELSGGGK